MGFLDNECICWVLLDIAKSLYWVDVPIYFLMQNVWEFLPVHYHSKVILWDNFSLNKGEGGEKPDSAPLSLLCIKKKCEVGIVWKISLLPQRTSPICTLRSLHTHTNFFLRPADTAFLLCIKDAIRFRLSVEDRSFRIAALLGNDMACILDLSAGADSRASAVYSWHVTQERGVNL